MLACTIHAKEDLRKAFELAKDKTQSTKVQVVLRVTGRANHRVRIVR